MERERMREPEAQEGYDQRAIQRAFKEWNAEEKTRAEKGRIVIKGKEIPWTLNQQAITKWYSANGYDDVTYAALDTPHIFAQQLRTYSGRHTHQGGFALFVLEGRGYTLVNGVRHDWKEGDLIILPIRPGGDEHQHFNLDPEKPSVWLAFMHRHLWEELGRVLYQKEPHPMWKALGKQVEENIGDLEILKDEWTV